MTISRNLSALAQNVSSTGTLNPESALPSQTNNGGKYLTTNGSVSSWAYATGLGVPTGGTTGQVLTKTSATDYATAFSTLNTSYLSDVVITSAANGQILQYDNATSKWKNVDSPYAPLASPTFTGTVSGITKSMVGLGSVDNTSDANKPISTATQTALDAKAPLASPTFTGTVGGITKSMVGLGNVENTALSTWAGSTAITSLGTVTVGSAPASDVYAWAKAATKPTYTATEVGLGNVTNESKATMFSSPTFTGTTAMSSATVSSAPSANTDVVNKTYSDSGVQTLTNKRVQSRVLVAASDTTFAVNADSYDAAEMVMTGAAGTLLISAPTGTPVNGQKLIYKLQCTFAQTLNWASIFQGSTDLSLPLTSSGNSKWDFYGFVYNSTAAKWQFIAKMAGF